MNPPIPKCLNINCDNPCEMDKTRPRPFCSRCRKLEHQPWSHRQRILTYKRHTCSNHTAHLGWECPTDFTKIPEGTRGLTEIDHKDGNPWNNTLDNVQELCVMCHRIKTMRDQNYLTHSLNKETNT